MRHLVSIGLGVGLAGVVLAGAVGPWKMGTDQDKLVVAELTSKMKTYCIGRFVIDMPEEAEIEL